jgi:copper chaperone CopZ
MEKEFKVKGMHCDSCNFIIRENVSEVKGVSAVKPDFKSGSVKVKFAAPATETQIRSAIEKEGGYRVQ